MARILTAMSGGVDSAVTAALLQEMGYEVGGATMLLRPGGEEEAAAAEAAARRMGIPFHLFCWQKEFDREVVEPFARVYRSGGTPNPCIFCNKAMKFGRFLEEALKLGYDGIATGHYAVVERDEDSGRYRLRNARDVAKDQTYMLASLSQFQLGHTVLPLGPYTKDQVRQKALERGLLEQVAKKDSQDICFVPDGDYMAFLRQRGWEPQAGNFLDQDGRVLCPHQGYEGYTIGQRRGLNVAAGRRIYVLDKPRPNVVLGDGAGLYSARVEVEGMNWIPWDQPPGALRATAKLRYTAKPAPCTVVPSGDGAVLEFLEPQRAVTPGQTAVLYDGDQVLGGGFIVRSDKYTPGNFDANPCREG